jgi:hypothetical protein
MLTTASGGTSRVNPAVVIWYILPFRQNGTYRPNGRVSSLDAHTSFTRFRSSIPDVEWFAQEFLYQCSHWRASAYVGGPNLLTWEDIYHRPRPAIEWRWMFYGIFPETGNDSPLRRRLKVAHLVDSGTGATFQALESRGYVLCRYEPVVIGDPLVYIQITPAGRKLVRAATDQQREKALPPGTLREWHWKALAEAWKARPAGLKSEYGENYGHISWNTWLRLRDFKAGPLIEEYATSGEYLVHVGYTPQIHWLCLSAPGEQFYRENWQLYRELYPEVDAPEPD